MSKQHTEERDATTSPNVSKREMAREMAKRAYKKTREKVRKRDPGVLPKAALDLLDEVGNDSIRSVEVVRRPVVKYATAAMEGLSLGKFNDALKDAPYDQLFHLSLVLNDRYVLEKCEVIRFADALGKIVSDDSETMDVAIPSSVAEDELTFQDLFANTREGMGNDAFTGYHARSNNCQDFVLGVLRYNSLSTLEVDSFVKQDAEQVFQKMPGYMVTVSRAMTDTAAVADKVLEDARVKVNEQLTKTESPKILVQKMTLDREKSIEQVESMMKDMASKVQKVTLDREKSIEKVESKMKDMASKAKRLIL